MMMNVQITSHVFKRNVRIHVPTLHVVSMRNAEEEITVLFAHASEDMKETHIQYVLSVRIHLRMPFFN